jgi:predicted ATPase/DNA-binding CsgD family transcriptional regulator
MGMQGETAAPLPRWLTSFVGRAGELTDLRRLVAGSRLVTVTGPGGVGKTRLAAHASAGLAGRFLAGVLFVDLAAVSGKEQVEPALASVLAAGETGGRSPLNAILERLGGASVLLVLDNCEHLIEECARVARVLVDRCAGLTVLATSREPLSVAGEVVFALSPLLEDEAVRLFTERARDRSPGFADSASPDVIRRVCMRLDGLPLAIELAAARAGLVSVGEIEERLARRFELLAGGRRDSPPRHQALGAMVDWSYLLLDEDESRLFRSLSVMAGEFGLAAAEALGGDGSFRVLGRLVDKSMVAAMPGPGGTRYRLLETLRDYGLEQLAAAGEADAALGRHFAYFAGVAEAAYDRRIATGSDFELVRLSRDWGNLRAALGWAEATDPAAALRLAGAMREIWARQGVAEGRSLLARLIAGYPGRDGWLGRALLALGHLAMRQMDHAEAQRAFERSHAVCAGAGDISGQAWAAYYRGVAATLGGGHLDARIWLEKASQQFSSCGSRFGLCRVAGSMGQLLVVSGGDRAEARRLLTEELALADELGEPWSCGHAHTFLAALELGEGRAPEAARHALSAAEEFTPGSDLVMISVALAFLARALATKNPYRAVRLASAAAAMQTRVGSQLNTVPQTAIEETRALALRTAGAEAAERAWREGQQLSLDEAIGVARGSRPRPKPGGLTPREQEVAELVSDGLTNRAVASRLHLSERTVENHVLRACTKLGLANRIQLARWVQERSTGLSTR